MAKTESLLGTIAEIAPTDPDTPALTTSINFRNGGSALLAVDSTASRLRSRLELLRQLNWPADVSVETTNATERFAQDVDIPVVGRVEEIRTVTEGRLIHFDRSAAPYLLRADSPSFNVLHELFSCAQHESTLLVVSSKRRYEITNASEAESIVYDDNDVMQKRPVDELLDDEVLALLTPLAPDVASEFCRRMDTTGSCGMPGSIADDCIPFRFPDDGCFARAHRMCELFEAAGVVAGKIWIYGDALTATTSNHPQCRVTWTWHVATIVKSQETGNPVVLDPSLFDDPTDVNTFVQTLHDPTAQIRITTMAPFIRAKDGRFIPEGVLRSSGIDQTEAYLRIYREMLTTRNPPYSCPPESGAFE
jgi:hypothetical protein